MRINLLSALLFIASALPLTAQNSATATITAVVQTRTLTITKTRDLDVGAIRQGESKSVAPAAPEAAAFTISGLPNTRVNVTFAAPASLSYSSYMLPTTLWRVRFSTTSSPDGGTDFTSLASPISFTLNGDGLGYLYLGATATASNTQFPGTYTGMLTLTVVYY